MVRLIKPPYPHSRARQHHQAKPAKDGNSDDQKSGAMSEHNEVLVRLQGLEILKIKEVEVFAQPLAWLDR